MKRLSILFAATLLLGGCAGEGGPSAEEVQAQLERGVRGEGRLGTIDRTDDPYVKDREGTRLPEAGP